jgi:hypothetical protein
VTWVEQLATKKVHVGAFHTIAVSSKGFSKPAIKAAALHGIGIRTINEVTDHDILNWVHSLEVEVVDTSCELGKLALVYEGDHAGAHLDAGSAAQWTLHGWAARIFHDLTKGEDLSLAELVSRAVPKQRLPFSPSASLTVTLPPQSGATFSNDPLAFLAIGVPRDGTTLERTFWIDFIDESIAAATTHGMLKLSRLGFEVTLSSSRQLVPATRILSYSNEQATIAHIAEREVELQANGDRIVITQHRLDSNPRDA